MFSDNFRRGEGKGSGKAGSKAVSKLADIGWKAFQAVNTALPEGRSIQPQWAAEPLLKSYERTAPPLGFPRETDSLCPACVKSVRNGVISGDIPLDILHGRLSGNGFRIRFPVFFGSSIRRRKRPADFAEGGLLACGQPLAGARAALLQMDDLVGIVRLQRGCC